MEKVMEELLPILDVEHDLILSKQGDITIGFACELPEIFTLSNEEYESFHQAWIKAINLLPKHCILHKQDWFVDSKYQADFGSGKSFLSRSSERFFKDRPYLHHSCYLFLTKKPAGRKLSSSLFSNLCRKHIVPEENMSQQLVQDFLDSAGQFRKIMEDCGFVKLSRLTGDELLSTKKKAGIIEKYLRLSDSNLLQDIDFRKGIKVGDKHMQVFSLSGAEDLPSVCGSRINYDRYSTDRTKFPVGFASMLGLLLPCNHIYNQYIFIGDAQATLKKLESKRLRLQSLSAYSRENAIGQDATSDFLNEAIAEQRLPVKAHFNVMVWTSDKEELKDLKNITSSALAAIDATAKLETTGAPQVFWAGIPGNAADFPMNDTFDTFTEQACCFLSLETNYRDNNSEIGMRLGDRLTGRPVHTDLSDWPMKAGFITARNRFILGPSGDDRVIFK